MNSNYQGNRHICEQIKPFNGHKLTTFCRFKKKQQIHSLSSNNSLFGGFQFAETLILEANNPDHQNLRFAIYDAENLTSKDLHKHQLIGSVEVELLRILETAQDNNNKEHREKCYDLRFQDSAKKRGRIYIEAEAVDQRSVNTSVKLCLSALKLSRKGLNIFGKCDAYFELERKLHEVYHPVYRSEVVFRNSEPR